MNHVPSLWAFVLLGLAAFRVTRLIGWDEITEKWRRKKMLRSKLRRHRYLQKLLVCPWCMGWWVCVLWWLAFLLFPHATLIVATPWALSGLVGLTAKNLDP